MDLIRTQAPVRPSFAELNAMGFSAARLGFYRWLVEHGRDPEYVVDSAPVYQKTAIASPVSLTWTPAAV